MKVNDRICTPLSGSTLRSRLCMMIAILLIRAVTAVAQQPRAVTGSVVDDFGTPMVGVTIVVRGASSGTHSGRNGEFAITLPNNATEGTLIFTSVGMKRTERKVRAGDKIKVQMMPSNSELSEVVIETTGYTQTDKRISTSSIVTITGDKVIEAPAATLDNMLIGKVPGMTVIGSTSTPGAATKIRVRGVSTISGNREPLWVVDGIILDDPVPLSAEEINSLDNVNLIGNAISGLNPSDIEKIDILKDAAATAIYGVRAANGVIVVTTKSGREGRFDINYTANLNILTRPSYDRLFLMNSKERIAVSKEIEQRGLKFLYPPARVGYEGALLDLHERVITEDQFLDRVQQLETNNTDWFDLLYHNTLQQKHNLSLSGGTQKVRYYVSGAYVDQPSTVKDNDLRRYNASIKVDLKPSDKISGMLQLRTNSETKNYTHPSVSPYAYAYNTARSIPAYNDDGSLSFYNRELGYPIQNRLNPLVYNVLHEMDHTGNEVKNNSYNISGNLTYKPITNLTLSTTFGLSTANTTSRTWFDEQSYQAATLRRTNYGDVLPKDDENFREKQSQLPYGGGLTTMNSRSNSWQVRAQVIYTLHLGNAHTFTLNAGPEARSVHYEGYRSTRYGYLPDRGMTFANINPAVWLKYGEMTLQEPDVVTDRLTNVVSLFSNFTYSYYNRYIMTFNMRADGSNKFGRNPRERFLPVWSVSGRWNAHNESFLQNVEWLNMLAFRASYGVQGNVSDEATPYLIVRTGPLDEVSGEYYNKVVRLPNPNLRWEQNKSYNVGTELGFWGNRVSFTFDYYYRKGLDQVVSKNVSPTIGTRTLMINSGELINKGFDLALNVIPVVTKNFTWSLNLNGARNVNYVQNAQETRRTPYLDYLNGNVIINGEPVNVFYSYKFGGLNEKGLPTFLGTEQANEMTKEELFARVFERSGQRTPLMQGGVGSTFRYKDLSLNFFFAYSLGNKVRLNDLYDNVGQRLPQPQQNMSREFLERWREPGDEAHTVIPVLTNSPFSRGKNLSIFGNTGNENFIEYARNDWQMYNKSNIRVVSGSYLRLRNVSLVYNFPKGLLEPTPLKSASIRAEAYNLWLMASKELHGQDPDQVSLGSRSEPPLPSYALTFSLNF